MSFSRMFTREFQPFFPGMESVDLLEESVTSIKANDLYRHVISTEAFTRLKDVSFLGAIDYLPFFAQRSKTVRSRADHSLNVAALANIVANKRGYDRELTDHLVIAGLLHDIGHPPLSHSVEPYLKYKFGYGHHEMGEMIIDGKVGIAKELNSILQNRIDTEFVKQLISGDAESTDGGDLFADKISLDTIDGIIRSNKYIDQTGFSFSPVSVALASFIEVSEDRLDVLDDFWKLKDFIYNQLITMDQGVLADKKSQCFFYDGELDLEECDLFESESVWSKKFEIIFRCLERWDEKAVFKEPVLFTKRKYSINSIQKVPDRRYTYTKNKQYLVGAE